MVSNLYKFKLDLSIINIQFSKISLQIVLVNF